MLQNSDKILAVDPVEEQAWGQRNLPELNTKTVPMSTLLALYSDEVVFGPDAELGYRLERALLSLCYFIQDNPSNKDYEKASILYLRIKEYLKSPEWDSFNYWMPVVGNYENQPRPWTRTAFYFQDFSKRLEQERRISLYGVGVMAFQLGVVLTGTPELFAETGVHPKPPEYLKAGFSDPGMARMNPDRVDYIKKWALKSLELLEAFNLANVKVDDKTAQAYFNIRLGSSWL